MSSPTPNQRENPDENQSSSTQNQAEPSGASTPAQPPSTMPVLRSQAEFFMMGVIPVAAQAGEECTICTEYLATDVVQMVACTHSFHCTCILTWLQGTNKYNQQNRTCPNCRHELYEDTPRASRDIEPAFVPIETPNHVPYWHPPQRAPDLSAWSWNRPPTRTVENEVGSAVEPLQQPGAADGPIVPGEFQFSGLPRGATTMQQTTAPPPPPPTEAPSLWALRERALGIGWAEELNREMEEMNIAPEPPRAGIHERSWTSEQNRVISAPWVPFPPVVRPVAVQQRTYMETLAAIRTGTLPPRTHAAQANVSFPSRPLFGTPASLTPNHPFRSVSQTGAASETLVRPAEAGTGPVAGRRRRPRRNARAREIAAIADDRTRSSRRGNGRAR